MREVTLSMAGGDVRIQAPESSEEFNQIAAANGASGDLAADYAVKYYLYHPWASAFRKNLAEYIERTYDFHRRTRKDENGKEVVNEKVDSFVERFQTEKGLSDEDIDKIRQEVADTTKFAPGKIRVSGGGGGKVAKKYLDIVEEYREDGRLSELARDLEVESLPEDEEEAKRVLAHALSKFIRERQKQAEREAMSGIGK